jgi:DNA-binding MarR family transcriptional regulator
LYGTTDSSKSGAAFPDDDLRRLLQQLVRTGGLLEPGHQSHDHDGLRASPSEVFALGELLEAGTLSQQELGARLGLEKSTVSRLAAGLEQRGWLTREREADDRRLFRLGLTDEGQHVAQRIGDHLRGHHTQLLNQLTPAERAGLTLGLTGLVRALKTHHDRAEA